MAVETENKQLNNQLVVEGVKAAITDIDKGQYWVAIESGLVIGQMLITFEWSDWRNGNIWWIQSVYIKNEFRRMGIFTKLYKNLRDSARKHTEVCGIRLYVEKNNLFAKNTYNSLGMNMTNYDVMEEIFTGEK